MNPIVTLTTWMPYNKDIVLDESKYYHVINILDDVLYLHNTDSKIPEAQTHIAFCELNGTWEEV
jgi:hypothetical protein